MDSFGRDVQAKRTTPKRVAVQKRNPAMPAGGNVSNHINAFMELNEKLSEIDITMKDELLVIMLLSSLPVEFEHFVIAIEASDSLPDDSTVKRKLLEEANRRKEKVEKEKKRADLQKAFVMANKKPK